MKVSISFKDGMAVEVGSFDKEDIKNAQNFLPGMLKVKYENKDVTINNQLKRKGEDIKSITIDFED